jgi:hypothetical protein
MGAAARTRLAKAFPARASLGVLVASRASSVRMAMVDLSGNGLGRRWPRDGLYSPQHNLSTSSGDVVGASREQIRSAAVNVLSRDMRRQHHSWLNRTLPGARRDETSELVLRRSPPTRSAGRNVENKAPAVHHVSRPPNCKVHLLQR